MKKTLKQLSIILPLLSTVAVASSGVTSDGDLNAFLADDATTIKVIRFFVEEGIVKARLKATKDDENRRISLPITGDLQDAGWDNNDDTQTATKLMKANLEVGRDDFLRDPAPHNNDNVAYIARDNTEVPDAELTVGSTVTVHSAENWERPDGTIYSRVGEALFRLRLEEAREAVPGEFKVLTRSWEYTKMRGFNTKRATRYAIQNYSQVRVIHTTTKLALESDTVIDEPTVAEYIALTLTGSYECDDNESGRSQGNIPDGYQIDG